MYHFAFRTRDHGPLFTSAAEASALWACLREIPGWHGVCLMLDHGHVLHPEPILDTLAHALSGYSRWWNHRHGASGPRLQPMTTPEPLPTADKVRRALRYVHLNPCRAGLVGDPLSWPLSTTASATPPPRCGRWSTATIASTTTSPRTRR